MAGDWIKIEHALPGKPEVMAIGSILGISDMEVIGHLVCFWTWVDLNLSRECHAVRVTEKSLDRIAGVSGFTKAMAKVGWISLKNGMLEVPNYDEHLSKSAKARALAFKRKRKERENPSRAERDESVTENRLETETEKNKNPPTPQGACPNGGNLEYLPRDDLGTKSKVIEWAKRNVPELTEDLQVKILECSRRARAIGKDPPKLFLSLVRDGLTKGIWRIDGESRGVQ